VDGFGFHDGLKRKRLGVENNRGVESGSSLRWRRVNPQNQNPENSERFRGANPHNPFQACVDTFFYPDYTVGSGVAPDHASYHPSRLSVAQNDIPLVGCTTDREFTTRKRHVTLPRRLFSLSS
jgi:hypothetical protein